MGKGGGMSQDPDEHSSSFFSRISPGGEILDVEKAAGEVSCAFSLQRRLFRHESKLEVTLKHFGFSLFRLPLETFFFPSFFFSFLFLPSLFNFFFFFLFYFSLLFLFFFFFFGSYVHTSVLAHRFSNQLQKKKI